jgi:alpha-1,3-rhamnosyl/mannosyltransferase
MSSALPLQLAFGGTSLLPPLTGIGRYTRHLVDELLLRQYEIRLFYGSHWADARADAQLNEPAHLRGRTDRGGAGLSPLARQQRRARLLLELVARRVAKAVLPNPRALSRFLQQQQFTRGLRGHKFDLYHEPNYLPWRFDGPVVISAHDISWIRFAQAHPLDRLQVMEQYFPQALERANAIIVGAAFVRDELMLQFGVAESRIHVTPYGVSEEFYPRSDAEIGAALAAYGLRADHYFLAVGTLEPRKNLITAIRAHAALPDALRDAFPLVLAGTRGWLNDELDAEIARASSNERIRWLGYVSEDALPALTSGARATVYPSLYEGFGFPPLESMACGTAVLSSNRASIPEVVGDAGLMCEALDVDAFAQGMTRLAQDEAWTADLVRRGLERARRFTWQATATATEAVYRQVLQGAR